MVWYCLTPMGIVLESCDDKATFPLQHLPSIFRRQVLYFSSEANKLQEECRKMFHSRSVNKELPQCVNTHIHILEDGNRLSLTIRTWCIGTTLTRYNFSNVNPSLHGEWSIVLLEDVCRVLYIFQGCIFIRWLYPWCELGVFRIPSPWYSFINNREIDIESLFWPYDPKDIKLPLLALNEKFGNS